MSPSSALATHLVSDAQGDVAAWTRFEKEGRRRRGSRIGELVRSGQERVSAPRPQSLGFPARRFEPVGLLHRVQVSLLDEVPDAVGTGVGRVLAERKKKKN